MKSAFAMRLRVTGLSHMRRFQYSHAKLVELDAASARGHRHETVIRHARNGVHFEQVGLPCGVDHDVDAPPTTATDQLESFKRFLLDTPLLLDGQSRRTDVARILGEI